MNFSRKKMRHFYVINNELVFIFKSELPSDKIIKTLREYAKNPHNKESAKKLIKAFDFSQFHNSGELKKSAEQYLT